MLNFSRVGDWIISETSFDPSVLGKVEANFCLGNAYLGLRSATEESYPLETRTAPVKAEICGEMKSFTDSVTVPRA